MKKLDELSRIGLEEKVTREILSDKSISNWIPSELERFKMRRADLYESLERIIKVAVNNTYIELRNLNKPEKD